MVNPLLLLLLTLTVALAGIPSPSPGRISPSPTAWVWAGIDLLLAGQRLGLRGTTTYANTRIRNARDCSLGNSMVLHR
jgi:hypothetical protein